MKQAPRDLSSEQRRRRYLAKKKNLKSHNRKYRRNYTASYILGGILVVAIGVTLSLTMFFNMSQIEIEGGTQSQQDILEMAGLELGTNLFLLNLDQIEEDLLDKIANANEITVTLDLPETLHVEIQAGDAMAICYSNGVYYSLSENQRVISIDDTLPDADATLIGDLDLANYEVGDFLSGSNSLAEHVEVMELLVEIGLEDITQMEIDDVGDITLCYQDRVTIELGSQTDLEYKLQIVKQILEENIEDGQEGLIDAHIASVAYFRPITMTMQLQSGRALDVLGEYEDVADVDITEDTDDTGDIDSDTVE